jgi:hypothetical protein
MFFLGGTGGVAPGPMGALLALAALVLVVVLLVTGLRSAGEAIWDGVHRWWERRHAGR